MSLIDLLRDMFTDPEPAPPPVRPRFPCGVRTCLEPQTPISIDAHETVVECPVHGCVTSWRTTEREVSPLNVIRPRDKWRKHGIGR